MTTPSLFRAGRALSAVVLSCLVAGLATPASADAIAPTMSATAHASNKHKLKIEAGVSKSRIKLGETTKVTGSLKETGGLESAAIEGGEPIVVQRLAGNVWVDVASGTCRPNGNFSLSVSFSLRASLTLRVYHPETDLYWSASSSTFALLVI
ncbi:hypothetical protein SAMN05421504_103235 [Amycolatopsis xylanica]|uniref:Neocarzinostatin family protein n=1 Tax=Amycolatopsis xylanica TaxID=589385 RepID=A0A1H3D4C8_9PSEU|nr:hypothetical protein [Amycolatopsis xylanica]SDX60519.1 hypothetical protein SAMN05421504_103235 [Amycolatopsis xylanica]